MRKDHGSTGKTTEKLKQDDFHRCEWLRLFLTRHGEDLYGTDFDCQPDASARYTLDLAAFPGAKTVVCNGRSFPAGRLVDLTGSLCAQNELAVVFDKNRTPNRLSMSLTLCGQTP